MPDRHKRQYYPGRQRRERDDALSGGISRLVEERLHILISGDRNRGMAVEPGLRLQNEVDVLIGVVRLKTGVYDHAQRYESKTPPNAAESTPPALRLEIGRALSPVGLGYTPV